MKKRLLAVLLAVCLTVECLPFSAWAIELKDNKDQIRNPLYDNPLYPADAILLAQAEKYDFFKYNRNFDLNNDFTLLDVCEILSSRFGPVEGLDTSVAIDLPYTDCKDLTNLQKAAIKWAENNCIIYETDRQILGVENSIYRNVMATILWNTAGRPESTLTGHFSDVYGSQWYFRPVNYLYEKGIFTTEKDCFYPLNTISSRDALRWIIAFYEQAHNGAVSTVEITQDDITVKIGGTVSLGAEISPRDTATEIAWSSLDENVAAVNGNTVIGTGEGVTTIMAQLANGNSASVQVTVIEDTASSSPSPTPSTTPSPTPIPTASSTPSVSPRPSHNPSTTISATVQKTDIEATNVSNHNGYAGLFKWDGHGNQVSNYESAFIDKTGRFLFPYQNTFAMYSYYDGIISCIEGNSGYGENMLFGDSGNLRGYYDLSGKKLISHNYKFISPMKNGYAFVRELPQGSYLPNRDSLTGINRTAYLSSYLIDENGNNVLTLPDVFNIAYFDGIPISGGATYTFSGGLTEFSEGLIGFWSLLPLEGNIFQDTRYTSDQIANLISTQEGYKGAYIGYMDLNGNIVIPPRYVKNYLLTLPDTVAPFKEGLARMANSEGDKVGFIDKTGTVVIPFEYDYSTSSGSFSDGLAPVKKNGKAGYINKQNQTIIPFEYDYALEAGGGVCPIGFYPSNTSSGVSYPKYGLVDYENNLVLPIEYDAISTCENGVVYAIKDHTLYIVTIKGTSANTPSPSPTATPTPTSTPTPIPTSSPSPTSPVTTTDTAADGTVTTTTTWPDGKTAVDVKSSNGDKKLTVTSGQSEKLAEISIPSNPGPGKDFKDVSDSAWYKNDVVTATSLGLFAGTSSTQFSPNSPMTRGMLATVLYRLSGNVEYGLGTGKFSDVSGKAWYKDSVDWAQATGVVAGIGGGKYGPDNNITREQLVTMLYRYADLIGKADDKRANISKFADSTKVSRYAQDAMEWAVAEGFVSGVGNNRLDPKGNATRAQVAAILTRFVKYLNK